MHFSERLVDNLRDRIHELANHTLDPAAPASLQCADPWLLASLLQKAIRRGDLQFARRAGHQLLKIDPTRLWRRLMTVGLEDIGLGDPRSAIDLIAIATLPAARRLLQSNALALDVALRCGCDAIKDRTGDHFGAIARELADARESHSLRDASVSARLAVVASSYLPWRRRLMAALLLSDIAGTASARVSAFAPLMDVFRGMGVGELLMDGCEVYRFKARDHLCAFVPLAFGLWLAEGSPRAIVSHTLPTPQLIGEFPDYAFDPLHTRLGRRAVDLWLRSYLQRPPFDARQVAISLWNTEAAACARTLDWSLGREIKDEANVADLVRCGLAADRHEALKTWIAHEGAVLACARRAVWESALREPHARQGALALAAT